MRCNWVSDADYACMKDKSVLVAGGTGFIGKRAVELFREIGMDVFVLSRRQYDSSASLQYAVADLADIDSLRKVFADMKFDYAVYMAANIPLRGAKKEDYYDAKCSTFDPFMNFCEVFLNRVSRFVYTSSVDVLGGCPQYGYDETAPIRSATPYGLAKYIGEFYTRSICGANNIPYTILRYAQVYGPDEPIVRIIPVIKNLIKNGGQFTLTTDGNERRRFLYIDDAVKAAVNGLRYANSGTYNIAGPDVISMKGLVELIESTWDRKIDLVVKGEAKGEDNVPSCDKASRDIHFVPDIGLAEGMQIIKKEEERC